MAKLFVKFSDRHPEPKPAEVNTRLAILVGTGIWVLVLIVFLAFYPALTNAGLDWWLHTAIIGILLGILAWFMVRKS